MGAEYADTLGRRCSGKMSASPKEVKYLALLKVNSLLRFAFGLWPEPKAVPGSSRRVFAQLPLR